MRILVERGVRQKEFPQFEAFVPNVSGKASAAVQWISGPNDEHVQLHAKLKPMQCSPAPADMHDSGG